jgi:hypothetical protein
VSTQILMCHRYVHTLLCSSIKYEYSEWAKVLDHQIANAPSTSRSRGVGVMEARPTTAQNSQTSPNLQAMPQLCTIYNPKFQLCTHTSLAFSTDGSCNCEVLPGNTILGTYKVSSPYELGFWYLCEVTYVTRRHGPPDFEKSKIQLCRMYDHSSIATQRKPTKR